MTTVGKILVFVIMFFAIVFLAFSVVVFSTEMNWAERVRALKTEVQNLNSEKSRLAGDVQTQQSLVAAAKTDIDAFQKKAAADLKDVSDQNNRRQTEITDMRKSVDTALQQVKTSQDEAQARIDEAKVLRDNLSKVQQQRDEFKLQKTDLDQRILLLERELAVAKNNNKDLLDRVALYTTTLSSANLPTDIEQLRLRNGDRLPPPNPDGKLLEGEVLRVSADNQVIEISIGSNDGLKVGHELVLYSSKPTPEYLGRVRVTATDVQQSVARVIGGKTLHGKKIKEGDHVTPQVQPGS